MRKILVIINPLNFNESTIAFGLQIAKLAGVDKLHALFIRDTSTFGYLPKLETIVGQTFVEEITLTEDEIKRYNDAYNDSVARYYELCDAADISGIAMTEKGSPNLVIARASRFTDIMVIEPSFSFGQHSDLPSSFVKEVLTVAECSVLLAPEVVKPIDEIVIAYDGMKQSIFAAKQLVYLLPKLTEKKVTVIHVTEPDKSPEQEINEALFSGWLNQYCTDFRIITMPGNVKDVLFNYFMESKNEDKLLVAGSYGRNAFSRFFNPAATTSVIRAADVPVLIAHT